MDNNNNSLVSAVSTSEVIEIPNNYMLEMVELLRESVALNKECCEGIKFLVEQKKKELENKSTRTTSPRVTLPPPILTVVGTENQNIEEAIKASLTKKHRGCNIYVDVSLNYVEIIYPAGCKFLEFTRLRYCSDILSLFYVGEMPTKKTLEWYRYCSEVVTESTGQFKTVFCITNENN